MFIPSGAETSLCTNPRKVHEIELGSKQSNIDCFNIDINTNSYLNASKWLRFKDKIISLFSFKEMISIPKFYLL